MSDNPKVAFVYRSDYGIDQRPSATGLFSVAADNIKLGGAMDASKMTVSDASLTREFRRMNVQTATTDFSALAGVDVYLCSSSGAALTGSLPDAGVMGTGAVMQFKKIDATAGVVVVAAFSGQSIDGSSNYNISTQYQSITLVVSSSNWYII